MGVFDWIKIIAV